MQFPIMISKYSPYLKLRACKQLILLKVHLYLFSVKLKKGKLQGKR